MIEEQFALMLAAYGIDLPSEEPSVDASPVDDQLVDIIPPKSSCQSGGLDPFVGLKEITKCQLGWTIEGKQVIVGYGCVNPQLTETHHKKIVAGRVAVNVDGIEKKYESLEVPIPSDEIIVLGDAIGSYIQWPKVMVILEDKQGQWGKNKQNQSGNGTNESVAPLRPFKPSKKSLAPEMRHQKVKKKKLNDYVNATNYSAACIKKPLHAHNPLPPHELSQKCKLLKSMLQAYSGDDTFSIKFEKSVFGLAKDGEIMLTKEDVNQLLTGAWISTSIVEVFIVAMQSQYTHLLQSVALMLPTSISSVSLEGTEELKSESFQFMTQVIQQNSSKRFIFCPYFQDALNRRDLLNVDTLP